MKPSITLLLDGSRGVYLPRDFANLFDTKVWQGISPHNVTVLLQGPDHPHYWEVWDEVLDTAFYMSDQDKYTLYQDDDLFTLCAELMSDEEYLNMFDEFKEAAFGEIYV